MTDLATAMALVLVIEGAIYTLFPEGMKRMMAQLLTVPAHNLRTAGLFTATCGVGLLWLLRS